MLPIRLRGARTHNLQGVDLDLEPGQLVAITGPSGAGKSSLALDTLYAEGQRRFVESFSPYARQFLERLERPPMDELAPIAATVAVDRRAPVKSSRSTLATMADLEPYLAGLFGREAIPTCPTCGLDAVDTSPRDAAARLAETHQGARAIVTYAIGVDDAEQFLELRERLAKSGYRRLVVGGVVREIDEVRPSEATSPGVRVEVVVDRVSVRPAEARRLQEAIETAWTQGGGRAELRVDASASGHVTIRRGLVCPGCARQFEPPRPGLFSYNSPFGACDACRGFGRVIAVDWAKVVPDPNRSLKAGAVKPWSGASTTWERGILEKFCKARGIPFEVPWQDLTAEHRELVIAGEGSWKKGKYPGVRAWFAWLETRTYKMHVRVLLSRYREYAVCGGCNGSRLNATALAYRVAGLNLASWHALTVSEALARVQAYPAHDPQGKRLHEQLASRLGYLHAVGIGYLTLDRQARTLSGGEAQRAGLTTALGAALTGTLFVLDEPTVGLHATDVPALSRVMRELASGGNSVIVVEHDPGVVRACDRVVEMGPGAGPHGGRILFDGTPAKLAKRTDLPTGRAWSQPAAPAPTRKPGSAWLEVRGARAHNLRGVDVRVPLGVLCAITGPSGSGKSTLAHDVIYRAAARGLGNFSVDKPGEHDALDGLGQLARAVLVDQSPLGRTARGNPATYVKAWDRIRARFAAETEAQRRGLTAAHFSFNVPAGRCEECSGEGYETVEMQFLADVQLLCAVCQGKRFKPEVLAVTHRGRSIADVLAMSVDEALSLFDALSDRADRDYVLRRTLDPIVRVGLGYLALGQPLSTLSGGEAQRLKLARALSEDAKGTLFVVDEPSAGLHAQDAAYVVGALRSLVDEGASVVVVEHDLDVIRACDWVIDLGPGGGPHGGHLVAEGTPDDVAKTDTRTGEALRGEFTGRPEDRKGRSQKSFRTSDLPASSHSIVVSHAREHNLKDVSCAIPHGKICVVTGPSGSGKSSLAFDVVFAEGQRRFMETLTPYARQFLPTLPRPDVDGVTGVPPSIALEQRTSRGGANSTVATVTEVAHYLRLLYAKVGELHCPKCDAVVAPMSADAVFERLVRSSGGKQATRHTLYAPAVRARKGTYLDLFTTASRAGVQAARIDGAIAAIDPPPKLAKTKEHTVDLIVYYGKLGELDRATFDRALSWGAGAVRVAQGAPRATPADDEAMLSTARTCPRCGTGVPELDPRWFSFNTKQGRCEACEGTGVEGGPATLEEYEGPYETCSVCAGSRLSAVPRGVRMFGETYAQMTARSVASALARVKTWRFVDRGALVAKGPHAELLRRLTFVAQVGLGYLSLDRPASTLSGGEMQRLRLSAQLGSGLTGALYVLDEPTIGLHPRDTGRLLANLRQLADMGSTVLVVEHDADTIRAADHVIDLGPGGGRNGGHVVAEGPAAQVLSDPRSPTARALEETARVDRPKRPMADAWIVLSGARANNLRDVDFRVPVGRMCVVAGVSGSGKSTLVRHVFYPALRRALDLVAPAPGEHASLKGHKVVKRALAVDQSPIGRTPRSVPATFLGVWDEVRKLYASLPEAKTRGYTAARFSFNTPSAKTARPGKMGGGRCPVCEGQGIIVAEMPFLPDVIAPCEACGGSRFEPSTLEVRFNGLSIGDVLHLPAADAAQVFANFPKIARPLATLTDLGVGYVQIGQGSNTLSGGEAQRLKLAAELTAGAAHEPTVYVLDEPTTGLHLSDVKRLLGVLERLVARGDTLIVIEHHPDVIASADWVVELGPEAGEEGGKIVFEGEPRKLASARTATGKVLAATAAHP